MCELLGLASVISASSLALFIVFVIAKEMWPAKYSGRPDTTTEGE